MRIRLVHGDKDIGVYEADRLPSINETIMVEYPSMLTTGTVPWKVTGLTVSAADAPHTTVHIAEEWQTERLTAKLVR